MQGSLRGWLAEIEVACFTVRQMQVKLCDPVLTPLGWVTIKVLYKSTLPLPLPLPSPLPTSAVKWLINFFNHVNRAVNFFKSRVNCGFNTDFVCYIFKFVFHLQVDVVGPLLLNASLLLVLMTDYSDWLVQVTELIDNWQWRSLLSFDDCETNYSFI